MIAGDTTGLWIAFPVLAFLSAYTPAAVNFVVGQASFTVLVVVLFNLVVPEGWRTGLVRLQDIAVGAAISVVVGFVLWPRGAEGVANETFAELLDTDAQRLGDALDQVTGVAADRLSRTWSPRAGPRVTARSPRSKQLAAERGVDQPGAQPWATILTLSRSAEQAADGVDPRRRRRHTTIGLPRVPRRDRGRRPPPRGRGPRTAPRSPAPLAAPTRLIAARDDTQRAAPDRPSPQRRVDAVRRRQPGTPRCSCSGRANGSSTWIGCSSARACPQRESR